MTSGPSAVEFPASLPFGAYDEDAVFAYELALRLHEGRHRIVPRVVTIASPSAGADWSATVPEGTVWIPLSIVAQLVTSAVAGNRGPKLQATDGSAVFCSVPASTVQAASGTSVWGWSRELGSGAPAGGTSGNGSSLPRINLFGGAVIRTLTGAIDVGDQWSAIALYVLEVRERQLQERAQQAVDLVSGAHAELYPGILLGL